MFRNSSDPISTLLPALLILGGIVMFLALGTAACALTTQTTVDANLDPTATNVPPAEVVVLPEGAEVVGDDTILEIDVNVTLDPAFTALTATAGAVIVPTVTPAVVVQVPPADVIVPTLGGVQVAAPTTVPQAAVGAAAAPVYEPLNIPIPAGCQIRADWSPYIVQAGDTIGGLAIATNTALADLVIGNCLTTPDVIQVGQTIYLPRAPTTGYIPPTVPAGVQHTAAGYVLVEPAVVESATFLIAPGNITVRAQGVEDATQVAFYMGAVGTNAAPALIGTDTNMTDGAIVVWQVNNTPFTANVWAVVTLATGVEITTDPILVSNNG